MVGVLDFPLVRCRILSNFLLLLCRERISKYYRLIWVFLHILLYLFKSWTIFNVAIWCVTNHAGELCFCLSLGVLSRWVLCLLSHLFWRVSFLFLFLFILSSGLLGVFVWCCLHDIYVKGFSRYMSGFGGRLRCGSELTRLSQ